MKIRQDQQIYYNIRNASLSPMTTKPTIMSHNKKDQQLQHRLVVSVSQQQQQIRNHSQQQQKQQQQQQIHILPSYVPTANNVRMALKQHQQCHLRHDNLRGNCSRDKMRNDNLNTKINYNIDNDDAISLDASSLSSLVGSIRPDPNYNPALDPLNPTNLLKPFIPPSEIIIKSVRGRRRKTMGRKQQTTQDTTICLSPVPTTTANVAILTPLQRKQSEWLQSSCSGGEQKQQNHQPSAMQCRSPVPSPFIVPALINNDSRSPEPSLPTTPTNINMNINIPIVQPKQLCTSDVSKSTKTTARDSTMMTVMKMGRLSFEKQKQQELKFHLSMCNNNHHQELSSSPSAAAVSDVSLMNNDDLFINDHINTSTTLTPTMADTTDNNDINVDSFTKAQHQQQNDNKQRNGMVRREFGRRLLRFKKKKTTSDSNSNDHAIQGKDIDRVFGNVVHNTVIPVIPSASAAINATTSMANSNRKKSNKNYSSIFTTKNIASLMVKEGQENNNDIESSIVV